MAALKLTRNDYVEGIEKIEKAVLNDNSYLGQFSVEFPQGLNTASSLEICRAMEDPSLDGKIRIMKICILGKNVVVTCPNGDVEKFCMTELTDSIDSFPLFQKEPLALSAIADCVYGYLLKKSLRLSMPKEAAAVKE